MPRQKETVSKRALCVGINDYPGTENDLHGCVNDAKDWKVVLEKAGYTVTLLLDSKATKKNMVNELSALVQAARPGDHVVFTYSGHGSWKPDEDNDDVDGRDEMLCPHDISSNTYLLDDELAEIFGRKAEGVKLYFISDSCHSGTVSRFAPPLFGRSPANAPRPRFLPPGTFLKGKKNLDRIRRVALIPKASRQKYPGLLAAGCQDVEFSYDAVFNGRPNGAFTRVAINALKKNPKSPQAWMDQIRKHLPTANYAQTPQLYGAAKAKRGPMF